MDGRRPGRPGRQACGARPGHAERVGRSGGGGILPGAGISAVTFDFRPEFLLVTFCLC